MLKIHLKKTSLALLVLGLSSLQVQGGATVVDAPSIDLITAAEAPGLLMDQSSDLVKGWQKRMRDFGYDAVGDPAGVHDLGDGKYITSSMVTVQVPTGGPGWVSSRVRAYERAQLLAKAELIKTFSNSIETSTIYDTLEASSFNQGAMEETRKLGALQKIVAKAQHLTSASLDQAIKDVDPNYNPAQYNDVQERLAVAKDTLTTKVRARATAAVAGATTIFSAEGPAEGEAYQVIVSMMWTPKLSQVAAALDNKDYELKALRAGPPIKQQIPQDVNVLISSIGVRVVPDEHGQFAIIAYAQAQPRRAPAARKQQAIQSAKEQAILLAQGYIRNFVGESIEAQSVTTQFESAVDFSDSSTAFANISEFSRHAHGRARSMNLVGLSNEGTWSVEHPAAEQTVVGAIVSWSPSQQAAAVDIGQRLSGQPKVEEEQSNLPETLEGIKVDISDY